MTASIYAAWDQARTAADEGSIEHALRALTTIKELGQVSFASKVLAAYAPEKFAVYDAVVSSHLAAATTGPWTNLVIDANAGGFSKKKAAAYASWCSTCSLRAMTMNDYGLSLSGWTDPLMPNQRSPWRAVDVERAFFKSGDVRLL